MAIDDSRFFAWLDGELDAAEAAQVEAEVSGDPRLARMAEQHRALEARVRNAFDSVEAQPVPERLTEAVRPSRSPILDLGAFRRRTSEGRRGRPLPQWAALAATLVVGILVGTTLNVRPDASPIEFRGSRMVAAAALDSALERQLASAQGAGDVRIGLTFRDQSGTICRTFTDDRSSGVACRDGSDWQIRGLFAAPEGQAGDYRMAAGPDPGLSELVDSTIQGDAFDARQEKAAREDGWR